MSEKGLLFIIDLSVFYHSTDRSRYKDKRTLKGAATTQTQLRRLGSLRRIF